MSRATRYGAEGSSRPEPAPEFESVLLPTGTHPSDVPQDANYLADLHLDDIVERVTSGREAYDLVGFFHQPLRDPDAVTYRQEVFRDLEREGLLKAVREFAKQMLHARQLRDRAGRVHYRYERERWALDSAAVYAQGVADLGAALETLRPSSRGLAGLAAYITAYRASAAFARLTSDIGAVDEKLRSVRYSLRIDGGRIEVARFEGEPDYGAEVVEAFARFQQGDGREYKFSIPTSVDMNHVEAAILDRVALLYPDVFAALDDFCEVHADFADPIVLHFDREVQFYVGYLEHLERLRSVGLPFCYPELIDTGAGLEARDVFDLALAGSLLREKGSIVLNDAELHPGERIIVVSGPNQGGKTTFARTFGQLHHLARIGVPVPGAKVRLQLADVIYSHFEQQERVEDLTSKLEEDLRRIQVVLEHATARSVVVMNESFSSTTLDDQLFINERIVRALVELGCLAIAVTFLDELSTLDPAIVSMVSTVDPAEPARRTFKIARRPADGLAYALSIAEKHGLTADRIRARLQR